MSDTDKTDKTPCSGLGMRFGISVPGVLSEGLGYNDIVSSAVVDIRRGKSHDHSTVLSTRCWRECVCDRLPGQF